MMYLFFCFIICFVCVWSPHLYSSQLSLDGKRLYVTSSLFSPWDKQFYPDMCSKVGGIHIAKVLFLKSLKLIDTSKYRKKDNGVLEVQYDWCRARWCSSSTVTRWTEECSWTTTSASTLATSPVVPLLLTRWGKHLYLVATQLHMFHAMSSWCPCCRIKSQHHNANLGALSWRWLHQRHLRGRHGQDREDVDTISQEKNDLDFSSP